VSEERVWPPDRPLSEEDSIGVICVGCSTPWRAHRDIAGGSFTCECGAWIHVPGESRVVPLSVQGGEDSHRQLSQTGHRTGPPRVREVELFPADERVEEVQRFNTRTVIELVLLGMAFTVPALIVFLAVDEMEFGRYMPLLGLVSGILVLVVGAFTQGVAFDGLKRAHIRYFGESILAVLPMLGAAHLFFYLSEPMVASSDPLLELREQLGVGMTLFAVAFCPAVFEEIAFRGVVQARFRQLFENHAVVVTAGCFAMAHGVQPYLLVHFAIGLYLSWLRDRSGSLLPGMAMHLIYNGAIVLMA